MIGQALALALSLSGAHAHANANAKTDELSRLVGHRVEPAHTPAGYTIVDVAGEGRPEVGTIERSGEALWLRTDDGRRYRLAGALSRPRIAGPGYRVWVLGEIAGQVLHARRLGVLAPP